MQECLAQLQQISKELLDLFKRGKISDSYYIILDSEYLSLALSGGERTSRGGGSNSSSHKQ
jgi:hypothetical protein